MKKFLAILLTVVMALSMVASASASSVAGTYDITIWAAEKVVDLFRQQVKDFNDTNTLGITFNATVEPVGEDTAATQMITDVTAGADIFCFAQDQFARLVQAGALKQLGVKAAETVTADNAAGVVAAATSGEALYAYPMTADNGYFMYYDKSVIPEADIDSMEAIIADCEANQKYFAFAIKGNSYYTPSFFFGTGCVSEWTTDDDGNFIEVYDTFNSPQGLIAVKGMKKLVSSPMLLDSANGTEFAAGAAVVVSGIWDYSTVESILGDNMGVTDLPSFEVDGKLYHLGSFNGCKLLGVKPQDDAVRAAALNQLALYLTGEKCQLERFKATAWGPSNLAAQASEDVQANPGLAALLAQSPYSIPQGQIHGSWWDIAKVIAEDVKDAADDAGLQAALDNYSDKIASLFTMSDAEKFAWGLIGAVNGTMWDTDFPMTKISASEWKTDEAYAMDAGTEFKVRQGKSWDKNFPADNFKVEEAGTYYVLFNESTGEVSLVTE
ncbi:MAG: extracellular solute-binding protein [Clostridia bacterium]|nr:extracellular solute-binding protein [Clostridia bacterium]